MADLKTVDGQILIPDPILSKQKEDVAKMRASLLACSDDPSLASTALKNITVIRVYHQVSRIIRYLEMMDKIEEKLYQSIDYTLETADLYDPKSLAMLMNIQQQLQKTMIESQKLLEPYLNIKNFEFDMTLPEAQTSDPTTSLLSTESRTRIRNNAQHVLSALNFDSNAE